MAIPYMGSKRKSAFMITKSIINHSGKFDTFVDLFCGGFAIAEQFVKSGYKVIANDKNKDVIALLDKTINQGLDEAIVTKWVSREQYYDVKKNSNNYEDWYVGYLQCIWSFGNNQVGYLFGKNVEPYKRAGHELVINKNPELILNLIPNIPKVYIDGILKQDNWHKRRIALRKVSVALKSRIFELERLEQLQQLERLQRLQQLEQLQLHSKSYNEIDIPKGAVVYCDPPYQGTAEYSEGGFNHIEFWNWVRDLSQTNKVFVSEYKAPDDFKAILKFPQKSTLQGGTQKHDNQPMECLFLHNNYLIK